MRGVHSLRASGAGGGVGAGGDGLGASTTLGAGGGGGCVGGSPPELHALHATTARTSAIALIGRLYQSTFFQCAAVLSATASLAAAGRWIWPLLDTRKSWVSSNVITISSIASVASLCLIFGSVIASAAIA